MGSLQAEEIAAMGVNLDQAISWHLQANHYPPAPTSMIVVCVEAIEAANQNDWHKQIELPDGITHDGKTSAAVWILVRSFHLDAWIEREEN